MREIRDSIALLLSSAMLMMAFLCIFLFPRTPSELLKVWLTPEYSHVPLVAAVIGYLLYNNRLSIYLINASNNWGGVPLIVLGLLGLFLANYANFWMLHGYGYLAVLVGAFYTVFGPQWIRANWQVFLLMFLALPFPPGLYSDFSLTLQLMATRLGENIISFFGGSVFRSGNIIDLGEVKLQVEDACSGLRYIIPLVSLSVIYTFFHRARPISKMILVVLSLPIAVMVNGVRVGLMGIGVEYFGLEVSEGIAHEMEGGIIFFFALLVLFFASLVLNQVFPPYEKLGGLERDRADNMNRFDRARVLSIFRMKPIDSVVISLFLLFMMIYFIRYSSFAKRLSSLEHVEIRGEQTISLSQFPMRVGGWEGVMATMDDAYFSVLSDEGLDDYILIDYKNNKLGVVNFYAAYYASASDKWDAHTPSGCVLASGWNIIDERNIDVNGMGGMVMRRVLAQRADGSIILIYYSFKQEGGGVDVPPPSPRGFWGWYNKKAASIGQLFAPPSANTGHTLIRVYVKIGGEGLDDVVRGDYVINKFLNDARESILEYIP